MNWNCLTSGHYLFSRLLLLSLMGLLSCHKNTPELVKGNLIIIPLPVRMEIEPGSFVIDELTWIQSDSFDHSQFNPIRVFDQVFKLKSGYSIPTKKESFGKNDEEHVILIIRSREHKVKDSYRLRISPGGITINAWDEGGVFYAFQTLRQIMRLDAVPDARGGIRNWELPSVDIVDEPEFSYRGMHLDVSRHFMPVSFVKKYIDLLAYYKMNRFHWHLTDDQGWRIEIKKYPRLKQVAAWRDQTIMGHQSEGDSARYDGKHYGGFYTQDEIREVIYYAKERGVMVIPEIEMPGHALAALAAYPELGCTDGPFQVGQHWGVYDDVFCPTEATFIFLQNVLDEIVALFPAPYIHIGGDEVTMVRWKANDYCQMLMRREGLKDESELQSYFVRRIEEYLNSKGKSIIGWDEILEGGIAPNATIMSWRGVDGGIAAAKAGHDAIMTPGEYCYFDHYQADPAREPLAIGGFTPLEKVYAYNPVPDGLTPEESLHILGAQGNVWTEYIPSPDKVEYMAFPRAIALAEVLWTPAARRNLLDFLTRLGQQTDRLDGMHVHYSTHFRELSR